MKTGWFFFFFFAWNEMAWAIALSTSLPLNSISWKGCALILTVCWPLQLIIKMNDWWMTYVWCPTRAGTLEMQKHLFCFEIGKTGWLVPPLPDAIAWAYIIFLWFFGYVCIGWAPRPLLSVPNVTWCDNKEPGGMGWGGHWTPPVYSPSRFLGIGSTTWEAEVPEAAWKLPFRESPRIL